MPTNRPELTEAQRRALALGDAERWRIVVLAATGERHTIREGAPDELGRLRGTLVLCVGAGPWAPDADDELYPRAA